MAAASSDSFKKSHVQNLGPTSRFQQKHSKSCSNFLCKSLIIILVLVFIPFFPSQAPDFVNQSIFKEFWELFHLLVIGIAVSYGLFCRKSVKLEVENHSRDDTLSGVLNVPSLFEDGFEKLCISDEKLNGKNWESLYAGRKSLSKDSPPKGKSLRYLTVENESEVDSKKVSQVWNFQHLQGETLMIVGDGNYTLDEHKPLGLPVRSLRSRIADTEKHEFISSSGSYNNVEDSYGSITNVKFEKIRGPIPLNLDKKFKEVTGPRKSFIQVKSERVELGEDSNVGSSHHNRAHSGGNFEIEHFRSESCRQPKSFGTSSLFPEMSNPRTEDSELNKDLKSFSDTISSYPTAASESVGVSCASSKARGCSIGSSKELNMQQRSSQDYFNDSTLSAMQHVLDRGKKISDSRLSDGKPSKLSKVVARGRSVRTTRSRVFASDEMKKETICSNQTDEKVDGKHNKCAPPALEKKVKEGESKDQPVHSQKKASEKEHPVVKFPMFQNNESHNLVDNALLSEKGSETGNECEDLEESSDEKETECNQVEEEAELEGSEVDRKADEFIAKFRQQMRLQKIASIKRQSFQT